MSYSAVGAGDDAIVAAGRQRTTVSSGCVLAAPGPPEHDEFNAAMSLALDQFIGAGSGVSPASEDSSRSTCSPVSPLRMLHGVNQSLLIKEELKQVIRQKQRNATTAKRHRNATSTGGGGAAVAAAAATASVGSAASSPGGGQARKRRIDGESTHGDDEDDGDDDGDVSSSHGDGLTAEDEERRKRRRERNKLAASKCRQKKQEKTKNLAQESETLTGKNGELKLQIQELEKQLIGLKKMLSTHLQSCTRGQPRQQHQRQQHPHQQQQHPHHQHHQHHQQPHPHQQLQHHHHRQQLYAEEPAYVNDPYHVQLQQNHHVAAEPPILKDAMFNGGGGYVQAAAMQVDHTAVQAAYHRPSVAAAAAGAHYPIVGGVGGYGTCVDDFYHGYGKDLIAGGGGGQPDLSHQYYDNSIC